ncbi:MAG: 3D domain-containing protein [Eubacteriales bacterium]|nr:3D domain-containing protein [Eubacteriales bacterium]
MKESQAKIKRRQKERRIRITYGCLLSIACVAISMGVIKITAEPVEEAFIANSEQVDSEIKDIVSAEPVVIREVKTDVELETIPYRVEQRVNDSLDEGIENILREGREGTCASVYNVFIVNGVETARILEKETIIREPVSRIVEMGTILNFFNSRGDRVRYDRMLEMRATSYTASYKDTGKHPDHPQFGITYTGMQVRLGIIAVDPRVIPLGTKVYVEGVGNVPDYGYAIAADIGSAIKGDLIDLYFNDQVTVDAWGCKNMRVYVLRDQKVDIFALRND